MPSPPSLADAAADLLLGGRCAGCGRGGRVLCPPCRALLPTGARPARPTPAPAGLVTPWAAGPYDGLLRALVVGHKERRMLGLSRPLGDVLAGVVAASGALGGGGAVVLVPVPSRPSSVRVRGHDPTYAMVARAARALRGGGHDVVVARMLRTRPGVADQSGLTAAARARNLAGSLAVDGRALARLARGRSRVRVVVADDVITTGATAREAQRALAAVGLPPVAIAAVAATSRRRAAATDERHADVSVR